MANQQIIEMRKRIDIAIEAVLGVLAFLNNLMEEGPTLIVAMGIQARIARAQADLHHLQLLAAHLEAATVVVQPLSVSDQDRLDQLARALDQAIQSDIALNATMAFARTILRNAEDLAEVVGTHA